MARLETGKDDEERFRRVITAAKPKIWNKQAWEEVAATWNLSKEELSSLQIQKKRHDNLQRQQKKRHEEAMHDMFKGEQKRVAEIWNRGARQDLKSHLESIQNNDGLNNTWMRELADFFSEILEKVQVARNWHGKYGAKRENDAVNEDKADYFLLTEAHNFYLKTTGRLKLTVVRQEDPELQSVGRFMDKLRRAGGEVSVQAYHEKTATTVSRPVQDVIQQWKTAKADDEVLDPPLNMLDLAAQKFSIKGVNERMTFLEELLFDIRNKIHGVGKGKIFGDMDVSTFFRIFATQWSKSPWHMDACGAITHVRLEGDGGNKPWICVIIDHLSPAEQQKVWDDFASEGPYWIPQEPAKAVVILLQPGDTLIMPPGTIHAVLTMSDSLMNGGMCWMQTNVFDHMKARAYTCENSDCTNENMPIQSEDIVLEVNGRVDQDFAAYGLQEHQINEFEKFCEIVLQSARAAKMPRGKKRKR
ncbi:hypothetical protein B0O99DRAFT_601491 [Bisporella sp. PMI_857]|nr:hypothetical protein B0O99DRAFT_601491 [Bisporella sp. PMI_857]